MNKKTHIYEFDPCIYPRLLWVVKGGTLEGIRKTLEFGDIEDDFYSTGGAITISAYDNEKKKGGFLVWFPKPSDMTKHGDWMAHEAVHVALGIFGYVGAQAKAEESEPFAYLVGWVFKCMEEVRKYKEVKNGSESESSNKEDLLVEKTCEEAQAYRNG